MLVLEQKAVRNLNKQFDEISYLARNLDVVDGILQRCFQSGFEKYSKFGADEGILPVLSLDNKAFYLTNYPQVLGAVNSHIFSNRVEPYLLFNKSNYLAQELDIADAVNAKGRDIAVT